MLRASKLQIMLHLGSFLIIGALQLNELRQIDTFFKISNAQQCRFARFVRCVNMKLFCNSANQNKKGAEQFQGHNSYKTRE
jgi:hypothetical protein